MHEFATQVPGIIQSLAPVVNHYGYLAIGLALLLEDFGVPVPGETMLITGAFFAGTGQLNILLVALVGFTAAVVGDNIGFAIGTYGGRPLVERYGRYVLLTRERLDKAEEFFNRQGGKIVIVARFIEGLRQLNGIIAGISDMAWRRFLGYNAIGAALWVGCWTSVGYFGGEHIELFHKYLLYFSIIGAALIVGYVVYLWWHNKNKTT